MATFPAVRAFHVFDLVGKTFGAPSAGRVHALCYELLQVDADSSESACEIAFGHSNRPGRRSSGYDGPSLSVGDLLEVDDPEGETGVFICQPLGFARITDTSGMSSARLEAPPGGIWQAPRMDLRSGRVMIAGSSWLPWIEVSERIATGEGRAGIP